MAPSTLWNRFRNFRLIVLAFASVLSLIWSIVIVVYMANNWSSYNSGERGFLFGLIALDFIGSILLYLMIVVQYQFWPDAARTLVLLGLHVAGTVVFMILSPKFPCSAFGSTTNCHNMTMTVLIGSWVISALILLYAICLPFVPFIPRTPSPTQADDVDVENRADVVEVKDDLRISHASSASQAWLLKNQEGMSPEVLASELPFPSHFPAAHPDDAMSSSSLQMPQPATGDDHIESEMPRVASAYSDASLRSSFARTVRAPDDVDRSPDASGSSSPRLYPRHPDSLRSSTLPNRFVGETLDANRDSVASSVYGSTDEFPAISVSLAEAPRRHLSMITGSSASVYSQSTIHAQGNATSPANATTQQASLRASPSMSRSPEHHSVHSLMASVHDHAEQQAAGGSNEPTSEIHLSDVPKKDSKDKLIEFPRDAVQDPIRHPTLVRPSLQHLRNDSTSSNVDLDEWRRLVLSAAGRKE